MCKLRTGVRLGKLPMVRRTLFCRRCNFIRWISAANSQALLELTWVRPHGKLVHCLAMDVYYCRVFLYTLPRNGLVTKNLSPRKGVYRTVA
jgi:hypothetical protein